MLDIRSISLGYGNHTVIDNLSLQLATGEIGCLLGASGCGKTTVLRAIAGFEPVRAGEIHVGDECVAGNGRMVAPEARRIGVVFQDYALFPHLNVEGNVAFGLRRWEKGRRTARVRELLDLVGLSDAARRYPHELSGGQQQRVALARALAPEPELLLLDEPFSNLDVDTRERLAFEVRDILKKTGHTALLVTHNQAEAFAIADRIGIMDKGRIIQWDTPYALHHAPVSPFVADFVKREVLLAQRAQAYQRGLAAE